MNFDERFQRAAEPIKDHVTRFLADLIERPSLSRDENATVQRIGEEMQAVGFDEVIVDGFGSAIGRIGDGPVHIVLDSHIDVVDTGDLSLWKSDPFKARIENGILYGRGPSTTRLRSPRWCMGRDCCGSSMSIRRASPSGWSGPCRRKIVTGSRSSTSSPTRSRRPTSSCSAKQPTSRSTGGIEDARSSRSTLPVGPPTHRLQSVG